MVKLLQIVFLWILVSFVSKAFSQESEFFKKQIVFNPVNTQYYNFRIPSIVITQKGTIIIFAEARKGNGYDWDPSHLVCKLSRDSAKNWTGLKIIADFDSTMCMSPVPIVDYFNQKIHLLFTVGAKRIYYSFSDNDGNTWKKPRDISYVLDLVRQQFPGKVLNTGPGHGIQLKNGRLIVPLWISASPLKDTVPYELAQYPPASFVLFSDDFGENWQLSDLVADSNDTLIFPSEASCVELVDGSVMFNIRNESPNYRRLVSYSNDGVSHWSTPYYSDNFFEPICHASMIRYSIKPFQSQNRILFVNPDSRMSPWRSKRQITKKSAPKRERKNLTLRISYDEGLTFPISKVIEPSYSGYSDLAVDNDGIIYCVYESGIQNNNNLIPAEITLATFNLSWATDNNDSMLPSDLPLSSYMLNAAGKLENFKQHKNKNHHFFRKKDNATQF